MGHERAGHENTFKTSFFERFVTSKAGLANMYCTSCQEQTLHRGTSCVHCQTPNNQCGAPPIPRPAIERPRALSALGPRERQIFPLLAQALTPHQVAERSGLTTAEVRMYRYRICQKLQIPRAPYSRGDTAIRDFARAAGWC